MSELYVKNVFFNFFINPFNHSEIVKNKLRTSHKQFWIYNPNIKEILWNSKIITQLLAPLKESLY